MRYLKLFEQKQIESKLNRYGIRNYTINKNGSINVNGDVLFKSHEFMNLQAIPFRFNEVSGSFNCSGLSLRNLDGCPIEIGGSFDCGRNELKTLVGGPKYVGSHYSASVNNLKTLTGLPDEIYGNLRLSYNQLVNLDGLPAEIKGDLSLSQNHGLREPDIKSNIGGCLDLSDCASLISLDYISPYYGSIYLYDCQLVNYLSLVMPKDLFAIFHNGIGVGDAGREKTNTIFAKIWANHIPVYDHDESELNKSKLNLIFKEFRSQIEKL